MQRLMYGIRNTTSALKAVLTLLTVAIAMAACHKDSNPTTTTSTNFIQVNLVSNNSAFAAARVDPSFINGWGIAFSPGGTLWISSNGGGVSVVYDSMGHQVLPAVSIPTVSASTGGHPTGQVFNSSSGFKVPGGNAARFIFVGDDGIISGWNSGTAAVKILDMSATSSFTGVAIANDGNANFLYAADFKAAKIAVFDSTFTAVSKPFADPNLPEGYSPFNIQNIGGKLYVMYAKVGTSGDEEHGAGLGFVDIYNPDGSLVNRLVSQGELNAPWGVAMAPSGFLDGNNSNVILVGNFGDGNINAYSTDGGFLGKLKSNGNTIVIDGLWGISFAPSTATTIPATRLYFAAGPNSESDGLFGYIGK